MANNYDISSQVSGYGSPGATQLFGIQQELMRRAAIEQEAKIRQQALERQQQQDELNKARIEQEIAASKSNVASNDETRKAQAALTQQNLADKTISGITGALGKPTENVPEDVVTAATKADPTRAALLFGKRTIPAQAATEPLQPGDVGPEQPAAPEQVVHDYKGTDEQRTSEEHKQFAQEVLNGEHDTGDPAHDNFIHIQAAQIMQTGKFGTVPAVVATGPKPAAETKAGDDLAIEKIFYDKHIAAGESPTDAKLHARDDFNKQAGQQAMSRVNVTVDAGNKRAEAGSTRTQTFQVKQKFRSDLQAAQTKLQPDLERVDRAMKVLNSPNFLSDAIAAPEVLQIMAGGMGSGLRMTDAELSRVNDAQSKLDKLRGQIAKYGVGDGVTIQAEMRKNMLTLVTTVQKARERLAKTQEDALKDLDDATSPAEVDALRAAYWKNAREAERLDQPADANALPAGVTVHKKAKP